MINEIDKEFLEVAASSLVNGLNACSLDLDLMYKLDDMCHNGWYDIAYDLVCDVEVKMNDSDRISLKYLFYHAKEDFKRIQNILDA